MLRKNLPDKMRDELHNLAYVDHSIQREVWNALDQASTVEEFKENIRYAMENFINESRKTLLSFCGKEAGYNPPAPGICVECGGKLRPGDESNWCQECCDESQRRDEKNGLYPDRVDDCN